MSTPRPPAQTAPPATRVAPLRHARSKLLALVAAVGLLVAGLPSAAIAATPVSAGAPAGNGLPRPTVQYEQAMEHAADKTTFVAGERVTVPFKPRKGDRWPVGGVTPQELPAGRLSGRAIRETKTPQRPIRPVQADPVVAVGPADLPYLDPTTAFVAQPAAAVDPGALKREVFGFLPYWELSDTSTRYDWEKLSTVAYFGVGASAAGNLQKRNSDGSTTVGWSGWTSSRMTSVINAAHASGARVVLTIQSFAWSSAGVARQKSLLGSSGNRANLARQIAGAVRDRGADGVNLDFEPIVATYADEFTALVRAVRSELNKVHAGYQLTFDTTGWIGNYPIEKGTASGGADAVVVMGYDYRGASSNPVGSVAPIAGPTYDIADTVAAYTARIPASKVILAVPYYGRAWSTSTSALHARNISGTKYGASTTVVYTTARKYAADHGKHRDPVEGAAWTAYKRQNCTAKYGCVTPWRQIYFDDATALGQKYDLINRRNLRGAGIWALGYDGTRTELYAMLKAKFITDTVPPVISASSISAPFVSANGDGRMDTVTVRAAVTGHIKFGWSVARLTAGVAGPAIRSGAVTGKVVAFTWDGRDAAGRVVGDGQYRITLWAADVSNNRAAVSKVVTVDRRPAVINLATHPSFLSPDGNGHDDTIGLVIRADEAVTGRARIVDSRGVTVRQWALTAATAKDWTWNGRNTAGAVVPDGRYTLHVSGLDRAGNASSRDRGFTVDRTIKALTWARSSFTPRAGMKDRFTMVLRRSATVTVGIYQGSTLVRTVWTGRRLAAGTYGWTWTGKTAAGAYVKPGSYKVVVLATSAIGWSRFARGVTVKAP
ncbi:MAG: glycosyl hydrolase family 18 protein [Chloroflexota bacterium]